MTVDELPPPPYYTAEEIAFFRAVPAAHRDVLPPLALKLCGGCMQQYVVEGDVGDEQGGTYWFGPCCPTPPRYADVFIREASYRMGGPGYCQCRVVYPPGSGPAVRGRLVPCHLHRQEVSAAEARPCVACGAPATSGTLCADCAEKADNRRPKGRRA